MTRISAAGPFLATAVALAFSAQTPVVAAEKCSLKQLASMEMTELPSGVWTVPMTLNGRASHLMLDTGGGIRALTEDVVTELGLPRHQGNVEMFNVKGNRSRDQVFVPNVEIAGSKLPDGMVFSVMAGASRAEKRAEENGETSDLPKLNAGGEDRAFDGILAPDVFFNRIDLDLDFAGKRFGLFDKNHCDGQVVYWPASAVAVVPFRYENNHISFDVQLDGHPARAIMDTGASINTLDLEMAQRLFGVDLNAPGTEKTAELLPGKYIYDRRFSTLTFEGLTIKNPMVSLIPDVMPKEAITSSRIQTKIVDLPDMIIGMPILKKLHIFIAFQERKLYITPGAAPKAAAPAENTDPAGTPAR